MNSEIQKTMNKFLFVGEERSNTAIEKGWTWKDRRLAAAHLSKATDALGLDWESLHFKNVFENDMEDIKSFDGIIVAMGRKVERELKKHQISHYYIHHPAARGKIRIIENYKAHVRKQLADVIP
jgi:hypothetical protein